MWTYLPSNEVMAIWKHRFRQEVNLSGKIDLWEIFAELKASCRMWYWIERSNWLTTCISTTPRTLCLFSWVQLAREASNLQKEVHFLTNFGRNKGFSAIPTLWVVTLTIRWNLYVFNVENVTNSPAQKNSNDCLNHQEAWLALELVLPSDHHLFRKIHQASKMNVFQKCHAKVKKR